MGAYGAALEARARLADGRASPSRFDLSALASRSVEHRAPFVCKGHKSRCDRGCTVFFSSHILSDAEALCSRVAIVVGGQLVTAGRLSEILAFEVSGWELVMAGLAPGVVEAIGAAVRKVTRISDGRYTIEVAPEAEPELAGHEMQAEEALQLLE